MASYVLGEGGSGVFGLGAGWSRPERGFTWTNGAHSFLCLPVPPGRGGLTLEIFCTPFVAPPSVPHQRVTISISGVSIASDIISAETVLGVKADGALADGLTMLDIGLDCPDAVVPASLDNKARLGAETRRLGLAVAEVRLSRGGAPAVSMDDRMGPVQETRLNLPDAVLALTHLDIATLAGRFESLGSDCGFGLIQRQMGAEPVGLLRFTGSHPHRLVRALEDGFTGVERAENLLAYADNEGNGLEYRVKDRGYELRFHTHYAVGSVAEAELLRVMARRNGLLRRKFLEDLELAEKIFVYRYPPAHSAAHVRPILRRLREYGPNALLVVSEGSQEPPGTVRQLEPDLFWGWAPPLPLPGGRARGDTAAWISVCANAYYLRSGAAPEAPQAAGGSEPLPPGPPALI